ncbi:peptidylprolyl isomerase [Desulfosoma caldarium]|uniref:Peptidyl-prolyl cis-trans isomerase C n=1 Tax=Desulfosoma caldarium TaxID=610254 RepID=A0A3N1VFM5_9BACT|nr:peptidylprolyl isomerase [Desulfosoma caldarium]ROR01634.1 peptidyl-prolyl cis-trans isomerase C [Desulfosoma caldarium]
MTSIARSVQNVLMATALISLLGAGVALSAESTTDTDKKPAATVNGKVITRAQFDRQMNGVRQRLLQSGQLLSDVELRDIKTRVLESLIDRELLYQESQKRGIKGDAKAVDSQLAQFKQRFESPQAYEQALKSMNLTENTIRQELLKNSAIDQLVQYRITKGITVSDEETKAFYKDRHELFEKPERVHARHILVSVKPDATAEDKKAARKKIDDLKARLSKGEDFATLAESQSDCPSKERGGDLGFFARGQMVKPFEEAAFALEPGAVSDVVETDFGYHLIQVVEKKPQETMSYEEAQPAISEHLQKQKAQQKVEEFLTQAKKDAKITRTAVDEL